MICKDPLRELDKEIAKGKKVQVTNKKDPEDDKPSTRWT